MSGFQHSKKVPTQYRKVASVLKTAMENREKSFKTLIYEEKHVHKGSMHTLLKLYLQNRAAIDEAIKQTKILVDNPRLNSTLCKILITELIYRGKPLKGESKPVRTVQEYKERLVKALGVENSSKEYKEEQKGIKPRYVRVNTNLISMERAYTLLAKEEFHKKEHPPFENYEDFLKAIHDLAEDEYMLDMHVDTLLIFHRKKRRFLACHLFTAEKKFLLQDKGTSLVAELLNPPVGSTVLDMCAAPGMKTIHFCNLLQNQGTIYAVEQNSERYKLLCNMITSAGCNIVKPIKADALTVTAEQCPGVEYILVDPTCTGSGMQNRLSLEPEEKCPERLGKLASLQIKMLSYAMSAFPDVKYVAYSTCSIYEEENEQVVRKCLKRNPNFKLLSSKKALRKDWRSFGKSEYAQIGKNCISTRPEYDLTDGIFIALFRKCFNVDE